MSSGSPRSRSIHDRPILAQIPSPRSYARAVRDCPLPTRLRERGDAAGATTGRAGRGGRTRRRRVLRGDRAGLPDGATAGERLGGVDVRWIGTTGWIEQDDDRNWDNPVRHRGVRDDARRVRPRRGARPHLADARRAGARRSARPRHQGRADDARPVVVVLPAVPGGSRRCDRARSSPMPAVCPAPARRTGGRIGPAQLGVTLDRDRRDPRARRRSWRELVDRQRGRPTDGSASTRTTSRSRSPPRPRTPATTVTSSSSTSVATIR